MPKMKVANYKVFITKYNKNSSIEIYLISKFISFILKPNIKQID